MKIKKIVACMLVTVLMITFLPQAINVFAHENSENRVNYLVVAKNESSYNVINQEYKTEFCEDKTVSADSMVLSLTESEAESIEEYVGTEYIEKDILFNESTEDDSTEDLLSDFLGIDTEEAEEVYPDNILMVNGDDVNIDSEENIVVGILDSGIANHDDLNVTKRVCLIPDMYVDNNLFSYDLSGHGTGVAGVIGAKNNDKGIIGIYENVELYSIQVLTPTGQAPLSRIVAGIDWAIENGVDVLNMSFGTNTNSEILYDAIVKANNSGMILVAAAGNTENATQYPAKYNEVISVGSVDGSGNISDFSAKDSYVDIYAPGESVQTTTIVSGYTANNGTSLAAPHVTAAAALIKAKNSQRTTADIKNLISATANKSVEDNEKGIIDIENMLTHADDFDYTNNQTTYQNTEPFDEYDQDAVVVGSWSPDDHQQKTNEAYNNNISDWQQDENINIKFLPEAVHIKLMAISSYLADSLYGSKVWTKVRDDSNGNPVFEKKKMLKFYPLHGHGNVERKVEDILEDEYAGVDESEIKGININDIVTDVNSNYVADVKYLYRLARVCMDYNPTDGELTISQVLDNIDDVTGLDANINDLRNIVRSESVLYTNQYNFYFGTDQDGNLIEKKPKNTNDDNINIGTPVYGIVKMDILENYDENNPTAFAFKILGLALHLVGDVYAHRTRVPLSSINETSYFPEDFDDSRILCDFTFYHESTKPYDGCTMEWYLRYKSNKSAICTCYDCFRTAISSGHVEFRDIPNFHENDDTLFFEPDNLDFYGQRYTVATKHATEKMILLLLTNQDFSIYTFAPEEAYTLKLNNLKQYIIDSGVKWNGLTANHSALQARIIELSTGVEI